MFGDAFSFSIVNANLKMLASGSSSAHPLIFSIDTNSTSVSTNAVSNVATVQFLLTDTTPSRLKPAFLNATITFEPVGISTSWIDVPSFAIDTLIVVSVMGDNK
jgi:hypothetical protein